MTPPRRPPRSKKGSIGGGNPVADDTEHTPAVSPLAGAQWRPGTEQGGGVVPVQFQPPDAGTVTGRVVPALRIPDPQDPETDDDTLTEAEQKRLAAYETALSRHRDAWWEEGKALAGIVQGKLHRRDYPSLEAYLDDRCEGMSRPVAYRRIELWPLGERLSPMGDRFNERQARALKPYADRHGLDAAEAVYRTIVETDGVKVTAKLLEDAVSVLPGGEYDEKEHVGLVHAFLAGAVKPAAPALPAPADPGEQVEKVLASLSRLKVDRLRSAAPAARKELAQRLRALADELAAE